MQAVDRIRRGLDYSWRGEWQAESARAICDNPNTIIQGPRQAFGKTWVAALVGATTIIGGNTDIIAFPTLTQSTRLLARETERNVDKFTSQVPGWKKKKADVTEKRWVIPADPDYEGELYALSSNETTASKPEGYHADMLIIDEGHRVSPDIAGIFSPFLNIARQEGRARFVILGVGGHKSRLIEERKLHDNYKLIRYTADDITRIDPSWIPVFEEEKKNLPDWQWRQHYLCEQAVEGMRLMYPSVPGKIDIMDFIKRGIMPENYFGIDVGKIIDSTVVKVLAVVNGRNGKIINEIDEFEISGVDYVHQAEAIYDWINGRHYWRRENIIVETNGVGQAFYDILNDGPFKGLRGLNTTAELKEQFWHETSIAIREERFGVASQTALDHYEGLMYEVREKDGKMEFEHSDKWMALCMAWMGMYSMEAL